MDSRKRPLHTCAVSLLGVADRGYRAAARSFNVPATLPSSSSIICALQCRLLAILAFADGWILRLESLAETVFPPSKRFFDRIDELVGTAEGFPLKFDDAIEKIPALVQQVPYLDWALLYSISWLEWLLFVLNNLGVRVNEKEKEINVVDVNYSKGTEIPDDRTGYKQSEPETGQHGDDRKPGTVQEGREQKNGVVQGTDREFGEDSGAYETALTSNGELKLAAGNMTFTGDDRTSEDVEQQAFSDDAKFVQEDGDREFIRNDSGTVPDTEVENDDQKFTPEESKDEQEAGQRTFNEATIGQEDGELTRNQPGAASDTDPVPAIANGQNEGNENDEEATEREEDRETFVEIAPENVDPELKRDESASVSDTDPTIADDHSGNSDNQTLAANELALEHQAFLTSNESASARENGQHELAGAEPGVVADENCETGEQTVEQEADHQTFLTNSEAAVATDPAIANEQNEERIEEETNHQTFMARNEPEEAVVPETEQPIQEGTSTRITSNNSYEVVPESVDPSVTSSAIVSETDETATESDCSSQVKSDCQISPFVKEPPGTRVGIPGPANYLVAWSNVVKGTYKDVLVKPGGSSKGKRHVKKVSRGNIADAGMEELTREGNARRKGRRKKGGFTDPM